VCGVRACVFMSNVCGVSELEIMHFCERYKLLGKVFLDQERQREREILNERVRVDVYVYVCVFYFCLCVCSITKHTLATTLWT